MFVRAIVLLYPQPSKIFLSGIIVGNQLSENVKAHELGIIMCILSLVWISSQLDEKPKVSRRERVAQSGDKMRGEAAFTLRFATLLLSLFSFSLKHVTPEARLSSGVVDFPAHVITYISRGGSRKFRQGWPGHLSAI